MFKKIIITFIFFFIFAKPAWGDEKFTNSYQITYQITASGLANVTEVVTITNKVSDYYPISQTFTYHSMNLGNIKVVDESGEFEPEIKKQDQTTTVTVNFRSKNFGIGKQTKFSLIYQTSDIASLNGEVWQILIPGVKNVDFYDDFGINLVVPNSFPEIQYASVEPKIRWHWGKEELKNKGIFLIFGTNQYYSLKLNYFLKNPSVSTVVESITIPPDTNYQKTILESIKPEPSYSEEDKDGNWIFWYEMAGGETKRVQAGMLINVFFNPEKSGPLTKEEIALYTKPDQNWNFDKFNNISSKISNLKTPKEIYDFTVLSLEYNYNRLNHAPERFSAYSALQNPTNAICTDFTNVFIALARKNGIPAREVDGYGQTQNLQLQPLSLEKDILHAWPEYYDAKEEKWIMVDPTWEKTTGGIDYFSKLDLNHVTFVVKGASSETPYPPGSYKDENASTKDVNVTFAKKQDFEAEELNAKENSKTLDLIYEMPENQISGISSSGKIIVQSKSKIKIDDINASFFIGTEKKDKLIKSLIPYETSEYEFSLPQVKFWENKDVEIKTVINGKSFSKIIHFTPIYLWENNKLWFLIGGVAILVSFVLTIFLAVKLIFGKKTQP